MEGSLEKGEGGDRPERASSGEPKELLLGRRTSTRVERKSRKPRDLGEECGKRSPTPEKKKPLRTAEEIQSEGGG